MRNRHVRNDAKRRLAEFDAFFRKGEQLEPANNQIAPPAKPEKQERFLEFTNTSLPPGFGDEQSFTVPREFGRYSEWIESKQEPLSNIGLSEDPWIPLEEM